MSFAVDAPATPGRHPAIICIHGASDGSKDFFLFRHLANALLPLGIVVARFDRRGDDVPLDRQVEDVMRILAQLKTRPDVEPRRIGLFGYSQGAWVAPLAASRSAEIAFLVLVASTGISPAEQMLYGTARHARLAGFDDDAVARIVSTRRVVDEYRRGRATLAEAQRAIDAIKPEPFFAHAWLPPVLSEDDVAWPDMDFAPAPVFARVRVPVLLVYGDDDEWQPTDASVAAWRRAASAAGNDRVSIVRLAGVGHAPVVRGGGDIAAVSQEYERALREWLTRVALG